MNISENLQRILQAKYDISDAINEKGVDCSYTEKIEYYADKIREIKGGGLPEILETDPLTFVQISPNPGYILLNGTDYKHIYYRKNSSETWQVYNRNTQIPMEYGDKVQFYGPTNEGVSGTFGTFGSFLCGGDLSSLINYSDTVGNNAFSGLFKETTIVDITKLNIKWQTMGSYALQGAFRDCKTLTYIPENLLPATTLAQGCYEAMFYGCTSLKEIPGNLLPARNLRPNCYNEMFYGCKNLTSIPENLLPATELKNGCYQMMFMECEKLTSIPENLLPATTLAETCYYYMFSMCTSLRTIPENLLPARNLAISCYGGMFSRSSLVSIPENLLPATTLADACYNFMFLNCVNLPSIPENLLPARNLASSCYGSMFLGCTDLKTLPANLLPATTLVSSCYNGMFSDCTDLINLPENLLPATTLAEHCYDSMFQNCTNLRNAPYLPAEILIVSLPETSSTSYSYMFSNCRELETIRCNAVYNQNNVKLIYFGIDWVKNVKHDGTFYRNVNMTNVGRGVSGVPANWSVYNL